MRIVILSAFRDELTSITVRAGHIFSAEPLGRFCLTGCVVTPGFDFKDFKLGTLKSIRKALNALPSWQKKISE